MKQLYILLLLIVVSFGSFADNAEELLRKGNKHYANDDFPEAIESYKKVLENEKESAELYFNMGNAFFRLKKFPEARLYYEKAKLLKPNDPDINNNLNIVKEYTGDEIKAVPEFFLTRWRKTITNWLTAKNWVYLSIASFIIFTFFVGVFFTSIYASRKKMAFTAGILFFILSMVSVSFGYSQNSRMMDYKHAIVFDSSVTVRSGPSQGSNRLFVLHEGTKVKIREKTDKWYEIQIANGEVGWLKKDVVERI